MRGGAGREGQRAALALVVGGGRAEQGAGGRAVGRGEVDRRDQRGAPRQADREGEGGQAHVAFVGRHVVDAQRGGRIVVRDGAQALAITDGGVGWIGEVDEEGLVGLEGRVAADRHRHRLRGGARREGQRAALALVVGRGRAEQRAGGRAVGRGEVDRRDQRGAPRQADREGEGGQAHVAFVGRHVVAAPRLFPYAALFRSQALAITDGGVGWIGEVDE